MPRLQARLLVALRRPLGVEVEVEVEALQPRHAADNQPLLRR